MHVLTVAWLDELRCFIHVCWRRDVWNWIPSICNQNISNDYFDSNCVMYVTQIELNSKSSSYISVARWVGCVGSPRRWSGDQIVTAVQLRRSCRNDVAQTRTTQQRSNVAAETARTAASVRLWQRERPEFRLPMLQGWAVSTGRWQQRWWRSSSFMLEQQQLRKRRHSSDEDDAAASSSRKKQRWVGAATAGWPSCVGSPSSRAGQFARRRTAAVMVRVGALRGQFLDSCSIASQSSTYNSFQIWLGFLNPWIQFWKEIKINLEIRFEYIFCGFYILYEI